MARANTWSWRWLAALAASLVGAPAMAQQPITFENLSPGTAVTTQYPGVTFSLPGSGVPAANVTIGQTASGNGSFGATASPNRFARGVAAGGDIPIALRMAFSSNQQRVRFFTGVPLNVLSTVTVIAQDAAGVTIPSLTRTLTFTAAQTGTVTRLVDLTSSVANIRTVFVSTSTSGTDGTFAVIDDLSFCATLDSEDPVVSLTAPADLSCVCPGSQVSFEGTLDAGLCGGHALDQLEYRSIDATTWTVIQGPFTGLPGGGNSFTGNLYAWTVPSTLPGGWYYFRAKMYNDAGRSESDVVVLYVDRQAPSFSNLTPVTGSVVRATVCLRGLINDQCSATFTAQYRPAGAGFYLPIPTAGATFPELANWPTSALPDGNYDVRFTGTDNCGNSGVIDRLMVVDNTKPTAVISNVTPCSRVSGVLTIRGQVSDAHLSGWVLDYTGGDAADWVTIATGTTAVPPNGILADWNTAGLRNCGYTLRLRASDTADNGCGSGGNVAEFKVSVLAGCAADFNLSGNVSVQDIFDFLSAYFAGCP